MRVNRHARAIALSVIVAVALVGTATAGTPAEISVSHHARMLAPGELVEVVVESDVPLDAVTGEIFGSRVIFYRSDDGDWRGLLGIDLDAKPGRYELAVSALDASGEPRPRVGHPLLIVAKTFETRRLTVDEGYVNPPEAVLDRIARESARVRALIETVTPLRLWSAPFSSPVPGPPTSSFGRRSILNGQPRSPHSGTDFRASAGTPVRAPNRGRVVLAADHYFSGNTVILDHGLGLYSFLAHLSSIAVEEGQLVENGELVGRAGATGRVTGPHLHWTVRLNGARVDPLSVLAILGGSPP